MGAAITACEKSGEWVRALQLLTEAWDRRLQPNVITYNAAISACAKCAQWTNGIELLQQLWRCGIKANIITYASLLLGCCKFCAPRAEVRRVFRWFQSDLVVELQCLRESSAGLLGDRVKVALDRWTWGFSHRIPQW